jgi:hypothetical protein
LLTYTPPPLHALGSVRLLTIYAPVTIKAITSKDEDNVVNAMQVYRGE